MAEQAEGQDTGTEALGAAGSGAAAALALAQRRNSLFGLREE